MAIRLRCLITGHSWVRVPVSGGGGFFNRCKRCGKVDENPPNVTVLPM
jgi:hypothetical protein